MLVFVQNTKLTKVYILIQLKIMFGNIMCDFSIYSVNYTLEWSRPPCNTAICNINMFK